MATLPRESVQPPLDLFTDQLTKNLPMGIHADNVEVTDSGVAAGSSQAQRPIPNAQQDPCVSRGCERRAQLAFLRTAGITAGQQHGVVVDGRPPRLEVPAGLSRLGELASGWELRSHAGVFSASGAWAAPSPRSVCAGFSSFHRRPTSGRGRHTRRVRP